MICVHGSLDPVKDASPVSTRDNQSLVLGACACLVRPLTSFPSLGLPEDIRCHRCDRRQERSSCQRAGPI
jgi:hypothetical protein